MTATLRDKSSFSNLINAWSPAATKSSSACLCSKTRPQSLHSHCTYHTAESASNPSAIASLQSYYQVFQYKLKHAWTVF